MWQKIKEICVGKMKHTSIIFPPLRVQGDGPWTGGNYEKRWKVFRYDGSFSLLGVMKHKANGPCSISWSIRIQSILQICHCICTPQQQQWTAPSSTVSLPLSPFSFFTSCMDLFIMSNQSPFHGYTVHYWSVLVINPATILHVINIKNYIFVWFSIPFIILLLNISAC